MSRQPDLMTMPDTRRLFFALWPTAGMRSALAARLAAMPNLARPMAASNLHVTLAFLGAVRADHVTPLMELGQYIRFVACDLIFDRLAIWKQARVLVLTATQVPMELQRFTHELQARLSTAGFPADDRPFRPHITLARDVRAPASDEPTAPLVWAARGFVLVESVATDTGVRYQILATFGA